MRSSGGASSRGDIKRAGRQRAAILGEPVQSFEARHQRCRCRGIEEEAAVRSVQPGCHHRPPRRGGRRRFRQAFDDGDAHPMGDSRCRGGRSFGGRVKVKALGAQQAAFDVPARPARHQAQPAQQRRNHFHPWRPRTGIGPGQGDINRVLRDQNDIMAMLRKRGANYQRRPGRGVRKRGSLEVVDNLHITPETAAYQNAPVTPARSASQKVAGRAIRILLGPGVQRALLARAALATSAFFSSLILSKDFTQPSQQKPMEVPL